MVRTISDQILCNNSSPLNLGSISLPQFKIRNDKINIAKISVTKLSKIVDPQSKLRKAVLINNTLKSLQKHTDISPLHSGGHYPEQETDNDEDEKENSFLESSEKPLSSCAMSCEAGLSKGSLSEDMLTLYDDIVNDIFGENESRSELSQHKEEQDKENLTENYKESYVWSPYSYSSFLSELYLVSSNEKLQT